MQLYTCIPGIIIIIFLADVSPELSRIGASPLTGRIASSTFPAYLIHIFINVSVKHLTQEVLPRWLIIFLCVSLTFVLGYILDRILVVPLVKKMSDATLWLCFDGSDNPWLAQQYQQQSVARTVTRSAVSRSAKYGVLHLLF